MAKRNPLPILYMRILLNSADPKVAWALTLGLLIS